MYSMQTYKKKTGKKITELMEECTVHMLSSDYTIQCFVFNNLIIIFSRSLLLTWANGVATQQQVLSYPQRSRRKSFYYTITVVSSSQTLRWCQTEFRWTGWRKLARALREQTIEKRCVGLPVSHQMVNERDTGDRTTNTTDEINQKTANGYEGGNWGKEWFPKY